MRTFQAVLAASLFCATFAAQAVPIGCNAINTAALDVQARSGCCSWHDGVCGCSGGRAQCCDGTLSPSCGCYREDVTLAPVLAWDGRDVETGDSIDIESYDHEGRGEGEVEYYDYGSGEYRSGYLDMHPGGTGDLTDYETGETHEVDMDD